MSGETAAAAAAADVRAKPRNQSLHPQLQRAGEGGKNEGVHSNALFKTRNGATQLRALPSTIYAHNTHKSIN